MPKYLNRHKWQISYKFMGKIFSGNGSRIGKVVVWKCKNCNAATHSWGGKPPSRHNPYEQYFYGFMIEDGLELPHLIYWDCLEQQIREIIES